METILINFWWPKEHTFDVSRPTCLEAAKIRDTQKYLKISKLQHFTQSQDLTSETISHIDS